MSGFIKIDRKILKWEWYKNEHTKNVFLHCLLKAYWKDVKIEGKIIPRGSFISSIGNIAEELALTPMEVRTALKHLKLTNEITSKGTNKNTVFTVTNYDLYQSCEQAEQQTDNKQITNKSQPVNKLLTSPILKEDKNTKKEKEAEELFEELWSLYPNKRGKGQVSKTQKSKLLEIGFDELSRTIKRYTDELKNENWKKPQNGNTFFNSGYVDYLDANYEALPKQNNPKNKFNDFRQREYDYSELEKSLLSNKSKGTRTEI